MKLFANNRPLLSHAEHRARNRVRRARKQRVRQMSNVARSCPAAHLRVLLMDAVNKYAAEPDESIENLKGHNKKWEKTISAKVTLKSGEWGHPTTTVVPGSMIVKGQDDDGMMALSTLFANMSLGPDDPDEQDIDDMIARFANMSLEGQEDMGRKAKRPRLEMAAVVAEGVSPEAATASLNSTTNAGATVHNHPRSSSLSAYRADDPFHLIPRFVEPQTISFKTALAEIQAGRKQSCWLWFILPTAPYIVDGVEKGSSKNQKYALRGDEQAVAYLTAETVEGVNLRRNYISILQEIERQLNNRLSLDDLLGPCDAAKAISSFHLFKRIAQLLQDCEVYKLCDRVIDLTV